MLLTEITIDDLQLLEHFRIERLRRLFAESLLPCLLYVDCDTLIVHCPEAANVDPVLVDLAELSEYAWLILGIKSIALYFMKEEIYRVECDKVSIVSYELC